jgi:hypothetical protein
MSVILCAALFGLSRSVTDLSALCWDTTIISWLGYSPEKHEWDWYTISSG